MEGILKNKSESSPLEPMTDKARRLTDDIQEIMAKFRVACKDGRKNDINVLVENGLQLLKELKEEISTSAPETPLPADTVGSFSDDLMRMLQFVEESDDATSRLSDLADLKPEPDAPTHQPTYPVVLQENSSENMVPQGNGCPAFFECNGSTFGIQNEVANGSDFAAHLDYLQFDFHQDFDHSNIFPNISPPPSAFLGPMCALWDCQRPAKCSEWCQDYCSSMHADLAFSEGGPGMNPVLRPGGIGLKDDRLFSALIAKVQGRHVGIPECEGAAIEKAPWNACKIFDLSLLEGETLREWLFFDKPRRAFESGNRKQRSLSDYNGRGWHESRKQMMKELGGHKRSYYMDPQPPGPFEWHLFEYVMNNSDVCALYKLELKLMGEKKIPKGKAINDPLIDLQNKMGMLTAEVSPENKPIKGKAKTNKIIDSGSSK